MSNSQLSYTTLAEFSIIMCYEIYYILLQIMFADNIIENLLLIEISNGVYIIPKTKSILIAFKKSKKSLFFPPQYIIFFNSRVAYINL